MLRQSKVWLAGGAAIAAAGTLLLVPGQFALSADHVDPPMRTDPAVDTTPDIPADIADIYAFHDANNLYLIYTVGGPASPTLPAFYDRNVLYTIDISTAAPASTPEFQIRFRFGPGTGTGEWGVSVEGVPGVTGNIVGPVEQILSKDGVRVFAGLRDDPFFFDSVGLRTSRTTGVLQFSNNINTHFFANKNITTVALEIPRSRFGNNGNAAMDIQAVSARFGGQL